MSKINKATRNNSAAKPAANDAHVAAARTVREAQGAAEHALVAALLLAITAGRFTPEHLTAAGYAESSAKTLASEWSTGAGVAAIVGEKAARDLVAATVKAYPAGQYRAVLAALRDVKAKARERSIKSATPSQVKALVKDAPKAAQVADGKRRDALAKMRGTRKPTDGKMAEAATKVAASRGFAEGAASLRLISNTLHGLPVPEGMEAQAQTFLAKLADACEAGAPFLRKVVKS